MLYLNNFHQFTFYLNSHAGIVTVCDNDFVLFHSHILFSLKTIFHFAYYIDLQDKLHLAYASLVVAEHEGSVSYMV